MLVVPNPRKPAIIGSLVVRQATLHYPPCILLPQTMRLRIPTLALALLVMAFSTALGNGRQDTQPPAVHKDPATFRAHDEHQDLLVAADPWADPDQYKARFPKKSPADAGVIAIDVYFRNDGAMPIQINLQTIRLTLAFSGQPEQNLPPLKPEVVADYVFNKAPGNPATRRRLPLPTRSGGNTKEVQALIADLRSFQLSSDLVPPHGTVNGFFYFDLDGHFDWIPQSRLYVPDIKVMSTGKALFFFDVPLGVPPAS